MSDPTFERAAPRGLTVLAAGGAAWSVGGLLVAEPIRIAFTAALARMLEPSDFGLLGIASIIIGLVTIANEIGLQAAIIQKASLDEDQLSSIFWFNLAVGVLLAAVTAACSPLLAWLFGQPSAAPLIAAMGIGLAVVSLAQVQNALVRRSFDFRLPAIANVGAVTVGGLTAVVCASYGLGVWSLVANSLVASVTSVATVQLKVGYRPRLHFAWQDVRGFLGLGSRLMVSDLLQYGAGTVDNAVVGYALGPAALGPYALAYNLITYPARRVSAVLAAAAFPAFARVQEDASRLSVGLRRSVALSSVIVLPVTTAAAVVGRDLIVGLYGGQWTDAVIPFQALCLAAAGRSLAVHAENVYKALGHGNAIVLWSLLGLAGIGSAAVVGLRWGLVGVAIGVAASTVTVSIAQLRFASALVGLSLLDSFKPLGVPLALSAVSGLTTLGVHCTSVPGPAFVRALVSIGLGLMVALAVGSSSQHVLDIMSLVRALMGKHTSDTVHERDSDAGVDV